MPSDPVSSTPNPRRRRTRAATKSRGAKPARLTFTAAGSTALAAATAASLVAIWPAAAAVRKPASHHLSAGTTAVHTATPQARWLLALKSAAILAEETGARPAISAGAINRPSTLTAARHVKHTTSGAGDPAGPASPAQSGAAVTAAVSGTPQQIALAMLASFGWSSDQFSCLGSLWNEESGWNVYASNPNSGAYGIPQALPGSKMASAGPDWASDAATQIRWGLTYIQDTYGSPCAAWDHEEADGWY
jgi:hypothetical protein